jgi:beta-galactosidase
MGEAGVKRAKWLQEIFHREDPTRPVTVGMDQVKATMESGFGAVLDVPGLNYRVHLYDEAFAKFPQGFILGSETASTVSSRDLQIPVVQEKMKQYSDFHLHLMIWKPVAGLMYLMRTLCYKMTNLGYW